MADLDNQVAAVTGSARGIGRAIAKRLAADGAHVLVLDVSDRGTETVEEITNAGGSAEFRQADITDEDEMAAVFSDTDLDILVNNAALFRPLLDDVKRFDEITTDEWDSVMEVNVKGTFIACKEALPHLNEGGRIVNIASNVANTGIPGLLHYVTSKAAVVGLTRAMANEVGDLRIRVNAVLPGLTESETVQVEYAEGAVESRIGQQAIQRAIQPEDIANAVALLSDPDAEMITGKTLTVDGGYTHY
jgi:NAD(P)-dependent dehydrogenase (short-subunit alcohol dehydrogenase family)